MNVNLENKLNYEIRVLYTLSVQITDNGGLSGDAVVTITLQDVNEPPSMASYILNVNENSPNGTIVNGNACVGDDPDNDTKVEFSKLSYSIVDGDTSYFGIQSETALVFVS